MPKEKSKKVQRAAIHVWDFTTKADGTTVAEVKKYLTEVAKKWAFQKEKGAESGYEHFQGRMSLKTRMRSPPFLANTKFTPTASENSVNDFYVTKEDTRIDGPWKDNDPVPPLIDFTMETIDCLRPWQQALSDILQLPEAREINVLFDPIGAIGKTTFKKWCRINDIASELHYLETAKDLFRQAHGVTNKKSFIIDLPRAIPHTNMSVLWRVLETIKDGTVIEDRYTTRITHIQPPTILVFTNSMPDMKCLSHDRWVIWKVTETQQLDLIWSKDMDDGELFQDDENDVGQA